jgi:hypothetical protein
VVQQHSRRADGVIAACCEAVALKQHAIVPAGAVCVVRAGVVCVALPFY